MPTSFKSLSELLEKVEGTKKRLEIIEQTADFLKNLGPDEIEAAVNMMVGRAFPNYSQKNLDVNWSTLARTFEQTTIFNWSKFRDVMATTGDIGSAIKIVLEQSKTKKQAQLSSDNLTIAEVQRIFEAIAESQGLKSRSKKERLIAVLISKATPTETKYLVKIFTGEMRTGLHEGLMEQAVAIAFGVSLKVVQHASMVLGDISKVAHTLKVQGLEGLEKVGFNVFRPVKLMLAQTAGSVQEALIEHGGKTAFEYKYDGARVQIHKQNGKAKIFSRRLTDLTESLPEIIENIKDNIQAETIIIEGEVIAQDVNGVPIAFQHLMRRFKRIKKINAIKEEIPLTLYLFDILYLNGNSLIDKSYKERRQILAENAGNIFLANQIVIDKPEQAQKFLKEALAAGHEGLIAKKLDSPYLPGRRGKRWLKIKPVLEPLDLVITAAEYGYGRRKDWLSDYYLAARDSMSGRLFVVGKTFKGLTDAEIIELTKKLHSLTVSREDHRVIVIPKIVVEVVYNEIQQSPKYTSKMALRFARINRIREDKSPEEASTIEQVREIYERQFRVKSKYTKTLLGE